MTVTTFSSQAFDQDSSRAKRATEHDSVFITDRGKPTHVLSSIDDHHKLLGRDMMLAEASA